jgi:hypothetical protein
MAVLGRESLGRTEILPSCRPVRDRPRARQNFGKTPRRTSSEAKFWYFDGVLKFYCTTRYGGGYDSGDAGYQWALGCEVEVVVRRWCW